MDRPLLVGAQAAEPSGITIWRTIRRHFLAKGVPMDYALFSTYESLDAALLSGAIDIAWNAPLAQARTLLQSGGACRTLAMRDTDREVATILIVRADAEVSGLDGLRGRRLALGAPDSSELTILPKFQLLQDGLDVERECELVELESVDHPSGERGTDLLTIVAAVEDGKVDAAAVFEPYMRSLVDRGRLNPSSYRTIWRSRPFSHCGFAARPELPDEAARRFVGVLASMDPEDAEIKEMMRLEHLHAWVPADDSGWRDLVAALRGDEMAVAR